MNIFNQLIIDEFKPGIEQIRQLLGNSKPDEKSKTYYDENCCIIC